MEATTGQIERYVSEAVQAGVARETVDGFLRTNVGRYDQLWQLYTGPTDTTPRSPTCACFHEPCTCDGTYWPSDTSRPGSDTGTIGEQVAAAAPAAIPPMVVGGLALLAVVLLWR